MSTPRPSSNQSETLVAIVRCAPIEAIAVTGVIIRGQIDVSSYAFAMRRRALPPQRQADAPTMLEAVCVQNTTIRLLAAPNWIDGCGVRHPLLDLIDFALNRDTRDQP